MLKKPITKNMDLINTSKSLKPLLRIIKRVSFKVLVVDDETSILNILNIMLSREQFEVITASSALKALDILNEYDFQIDLIISDVVMPEMDGYELGIKVLEKVPTMPILFISGFNSSKQLTNLIDKYDNLNYQAKPFGFDDIKKKMAEIIEFDGI